MQSYIYNMTASIFEIATVYVQISRVEKNRPKPLSEIVWMN